MSTGLAPVGTLPVGLPPSQAAAPGIPGVPTLSAPTVITITSTTAVPRVTFTF